MESYNTVLREAEHNIDEARRLRTEADRKRLQAIEDQERAAAELYERESLADALAVMPVVMSVRGC